MSRPVILSAPSGKSVAIYRSVLPHERHATFWVMFEGAKLSTATEYATLQTALGVASRMLELDADQCKLTKGNK